MYQFYKIIFKSRSLKERLLLLPPIFINLLIGGSNFNYIPLYFDQVGHSNFKVNILSPAFFPDIKHGPIWIDGTLNLPFSIYHIDDFPESSIEDSNQVRNYFKWKQGDFEYREISVGTNQQM